MHHHAFIHILSSTFTRYRFVRISILIEDYDIHVFLVYSNTRDDNIMGIYFRIFAVLNARLIRHLERV